MVETADVIIIGGGVVGASTAFSLARRGVTNVVVLERNQLAGGATGKSSGLVRMHYTNPIETRLAFQALQWFKHWGDLVGGDCAFVQTGFARLVAPDQVDDVRQYIRMQQEIGVNTSFVSPAELAEIQPGFWLDDLGGAAYEPESGYADPSSTASSFMRAARDRGVELRPNTAVSRIMTGGGRVTGVETNRGVINAPTVLIAANAWCRPLLQSVGQDLPIYGERHEVAIVVRPQSFAGNHLTVGDGVLGTYFRPEGAYLTLIGAGRGQTVDPDNFSEVPTGDFIDMIGERVTKRIPALADAGVRRSVVGVYDMTPDGLPVLDAVPGTEGLYCAVGFCGHGFKISPAVGAIMADLMTSGGTLATDLSLVRFSRDFILKPTDDHNDSMW